MPKPDDLPIHKAAESGNLPELMKLLELNPELLEARGFMGRTPMHDAVQSGSTECILYLLDKGSDINAVAEYNGCTPIFFVPNLTLMKLLIDRGADLNVIDKYGGSLLNSACHSLQVDIVDYLVKCGFDVNYKEALDCYSTMLQSPIQHFETTPDRLQKSIEICQILLDAGSNPNDRNCYDSTALHEACRRNQPEIVNLMLKYNADPNLRNINNETCFDEAAKYPAILEVLKPYSKPIPLPPKLKQTPDELIQRLLKIGVIRESDLIPCTEEEIAALEHYHDVILPAEFKRYLRIMGRGGGDIIGSDPVFTDYYSFLVGDCDNDPLEDWEIERLQRANLPEKYFEFYGKFDDRHFYFIADGTNDDPPIFMYENCKNEVIHTKFRDSFWEFFEVELESLEFHFDRNRFSCKTLDESVQSLRESALKRLQEDRSKPPTTRKRLL